MATSATKETVHVIQPGECVDSIAFRYGVLADAIWDHEKNAELRKTRERRDVLLPGDEVFIPPVRRKTEAVSTSRSTTFIAKRALRDIRLKLVKDPKTAPSPPPMLKPNEYDAPLPAAPKSEPWAEVQVEIVCQGFRWSGQTDGEGKLRAQVPMGLSRAEMIVAGGTEDERHFDLRFGALDPVNTPSGIAQRLSNLGYRAQAQQQSTPELVNALRSFQHARGLPITGEADEKTRAELQK